MRLHRLLPVLVLPCLLVTSRAGATYSIVGTDTATQQVGGAGTSCVGNFSVYVIYGSVPGMGVVAAQAQVNTAGRDAAVQQLAAGTDPQQIIQSITSSDFGRESRQYGIVDLQGRSAGWTGNNTIDYAEDRQGTAGTYTYSTQGNILTSDAVLDGTSAAFANEGCDLADKLMLALEAGADNGEGDSRCTPDGIPSDGAFIQVDQPTGTAGSYLRIRVEDTAPQNPISLLRQEFDDWRQTHPCSTGSGGTGGAGGTGGTGAGGSSGSGPATGGTGTGGAATGGTSGVGGASAAGGSAGSAGAGGSSGGAGGAGASGGAAAGGSAGKTNPAGDGESDSGCACRAVASPRWPWSSLASIGLLLLAFGRRRTPRQTID
jgi:uncharacterized Ntn-hydrolase superfamily protein